MVEQVIHARKVRFRPEGILAALDNQERAVIDPVGL
jgi:hypothetical protein